MTTTEPAMLALDDEPGILHLIKLELATQGFSVITAGDGATALSMLESEHPPSDDSSGARSSARSTATGRRSRPAAGRWLRCRFPT